MPRVNPDYPYLQDEITAKLRMERLILKIAKREGKEHYPAAIEAVENIKNLERMQNDRPA